MGDTFETVNVVDDVVYCWQTQRIEHPEDPEQYVNVRSPVKQLMNGLIVPCSAADMCHFQPDAPAWSTGVEYIETLAAPDRANYDALVARLATAKPEDLPTIAAEIFRAGYAQGHIDGFDLCRD
ncbi:hypothetical protein [Mesorhizobium sp. M0088]|uniref:hypothetical protein n=1 Tax=Mesorhizobium sp. M0088 TaxID=2956873 RepID=UPI00333A3783